MSQKSDIFISIIDAHKGIIYKVANAYCKHEENKQDLIQEIIYQLWKSFENYNPRFKHSTWIYRVALNTSISFYRKNSLRQPNTIVITNHIQNTVASFQEEIDPNLALLQQFIRELKEIDKAIILLFLEEKSHKEIAEILGISSSNVATKIGRIKQILRKKFSSI